MQHNKPEEVFPYVYLVKDKLTESFYVGMRRANLKNNTPPSQDIGVLYLTSSREIHRIAEERFEDLEWSVLATYDTIEEAYKGEAEFYERVQRTVGRGRMLNKINPNVQLSASHNEFKILESAEYREEFSLKMREVIARRKAENPDWWERHREEASERASAMNAARTDEDWRRVLERRKDTIEARSEEEKAQIHQTMSKACKERNERHGAKMWTGMVAAKDELYGRNASVEDMYRIKYGDQAEEKIEEYRRNRELGRLKVDREAVVSKIQQTRKERYGDSYHSEDGKKKLSESQKGINNSAWKGYLYTPYGVFRNRKEADGFFKPRRLGLEGKIKNNPDEYFYSKTPPSEDILVLPKE